jgi:hypothetical protein
MFGNLCKQDNLQLSARLISSVTLISFVTARFTYLVQIKIYEQRQNIMILFAIGFSFQSCFGLGMSGGGLLQIYACLGFLIRLRG